MSDSLRGRQIILAGGTGGLGAASTEGLHAEGARLIIGYRANAARAQSPSLFSGLQMQRTSATCPKATHHAAPRTHPRGGRLCQFVSRHDCCDADT